MAYDPNNNFYGSVFMEKARGRILVAISELNTTRKALNSVIGWGSNASQNNTMANAKALRGAAYKKALEDIAKMSDETLGDYSVSSNFLKGSNFFTPKGGRRRRKGKRTRKHRK